MEHNEVSHHEVRVYQAFASQPSAWLTCKAVAAVAKVAERTARAHCFKLAKLGILDVGEVFPAHRYRLAAKADKRNFAYVERLKNAAEMFA